MRTTPSGAETSGAGPAAATPTPAAEPPSTTPQQRDQVRRELDAQAARVFALFAALAMAVTAPLLSLYRGLDDATRWTMQGLLAALSLALFGLYALARHGHARRAVAGALLVGSVANAALAYAMQVGVQGQSLGLFALMVALGGVLLGMRAALAVALLCAGLVVGLYQAEAQGWIAGRSAAAAMPSLNRAYTLLVLIVIGLIAALAMSRLYLRAFEEAALQRERLRGLLQIGTDWIWEQDAQGRFTHVSESFVQRSGIDAAQLLGRTFWQLPELMPLDANQRATLEESYRLQRPLRNCLLELRPLPQAPALAITLQADPWFQRDGTLAGWRGVGHDVTALVEESSRRQQSEDLLLRVFHTTPDAVALASLRDGRIVMINEPMTRMLGLEPQAAIGRGSLTLGLWADPADRQAMCERVLRDGQVRDLHVRLRAHDGREVPVSVSASLLRIGDEDHVVTVSHDLTEQERERAEMHGLLQQASVGLALTRNNRFLHVNGMYEQLLGVAAGSLAGQSTRVIFSSDESFRRFLAQAGEGMPASGVDFEMAVPRRDGTSFTGRIRGRALNPARPIEDGMIWVLEDVSERRRQQHQLAEAKEQAEAASQAKSAFLATMSHEMRTPLNGVLGMIRLALDAPPLSPQRNAYLRHAEASGELLARLIADVLDLSRVEAGRLTLEHAPFDLHALAEALIALHGPDARARGLALVLTIDPAVPAQVLGDAARVRQVVENLLANAIKFTDRGEVSLALAPCRLDSGPGVRFTVRDSGIGIAPEVQARLFQPFVQADSSMTRRFGGTGLGLSICRELTQLMGGQLGLHSTPGLGSSFHAELPLPPAAMPPSVEQAPAPAHRPLAGRRVLVAEDHPVNILIAVELLRRWGAEVDEAEDGEQAIAQVLAAHAAGRPLDAVLMDMHMPRLSGLEATRQLRQRFDAAALPVIALTAAALADEQRQAREAGMNDFVSKPIDAERLLQALLQACPSPPSRVSAGAPGAAAGALQSGASGPT